MSAAIYKAAVMSIANDQAAGEDTSARIALLSAHSGVDIGTIQWEVTDAYNDN